MAPFFSPFERFIPFQEAKAQFPNIYDMAALNKFRTDVDRHFQSNQRN